MLFFYIKKHISLKNLIKYIYGFIWHFIKSSSNYYSTPSNSRTQKDSPTQDQKKDSSFTLKIETQDKPKPRTFFNCVILPIYFSFIPSLAFSVLLHIHTYIHTYIHTHTYIHNIYTYIHTNMHTYIQTYTHTNMHTCMHTYIHTYVHNI